MGRGKKYQPEQVVNLLRQIEVAVANGKTTALACKEAGIVEQTYFRWRKEYGGLQVDQAKRLKELEQENSKLKRLVSEPEPGQPCVEGLRLGKLLSPERRRIATAHAQQTHGMTERRACRLANQPRGTQRYCADTAGRRRCTHAGDRSACQPVRPLWVSPDHGAAQASRLAGGQGSRGAHLASRGAEGSTEAEATRTAVAQRWLLRAAKTGAAEPCVEL